jgi:putative transposase
LTRASNGRASLPFLCTGLRSNTEERAWRWQPSWRTRYLRSDNGPEFVSRAILKSAIENSMEMALSDPGKPWQNGANESFNGKFRDECLRRTEAKVVIEQWRRHYNGIRPHWSLAYLTPDEFKQQYCSTEATAAVFQD